MNEADIYALCHVLLKRKALNGYAYTINEWYDEVHFLYNMYDNIHITINGKGYTVITLI